MRLCRGLFLNFRKKYGMRFICGACGIHEESYEYEEFINF